MQEEQTFTEQMVKRGNARTDFIHRIYLILIGAIIVAIPFLIGYNVAIYIESVVIVIVLLMLWIMWRQAAKEYEYIYTDGNLDIDVVYSRSTRKHLFSVDMKRAIVLGHHDSEQVKKVLPGYKFDKTIYACQGKPADGTYALVAEYRSKQYLIYFEPDDRILRFIKAYSPRNSYIRPEDLLPKTAFKEETEEEEEIL